MPDITIEQLDSFLQEIKNEYAVALQKSEKSGSESSSSPEASVSGSPKEMSASGLPEASLKKDDPVAKPKAEGEEAPPPAEAAPAEAPPAAEGEVPAPEGEGDPAAEGGAMGADQLFDMYSKLDEDQLAMHFMACSKALYSKMDEGEEVPPEVAASPDAPPAAEEGVPPPMAKAEKEELEKLNKENVELKDKTSVLEKKVEELTETLTKVVNHPSRRAFTGSNFNASTKEVKSEQPLSKSEILAKLSKKAQDPNLTESDRTKIYNYSVKPVFSEDLKKFLTEEVK